MEPQPPLASPPQTPTPEMQARTPESSMWAAVAAIQAMDKTVDAHNTRLQCLEGRMGAAEKTLAGWQTWTGVENRQERKRPVQEMLIQLQRRLENMENLLKNRTFLILRFPPGAQGEAPKVPVTFNDISVHFSEQEWGGLDGFQKELYKMVMKSNYEALVSLNDAIAKPEILPEIEQGEELDKRSPADLGGSSSGPDGTLDSPVAPVDASLWLKQEAEKRPSRDLGPPEDMREAGSGSRTGSPPDGMETSLQIKEEVEEVHLDPGDDYEEDLCHGLEYRTVTVNERLLAGLKKDPCLQESLLLGEGSSTEEHKITVQLEEDVGEAKPPVLKNSSRRTTSQSSGLDPAQNPQPDIRAQSIKLEGVLKRPLSPPDRWKSSPKKQAVLEPKTCVATHFFECTECHQSFGSEEPPTPEGHGSATCPDCQQLSVSMPSMEMQPFACVTCGATFSQWAMQLAHQKTHHRAWKYHCDDCGAGAETSRERASHLRAHALVGRTYLCSSCPRSFLSSSEMTDHQRTHILGWPFTCSWCKTSFSSQRAFTTHQTQHAAAIQKQFPDTQVEVASSWQEGVLPEEVNLCLQAKSKTPWQVIIDLVQKNPELWPFLSAQCDTKFLSQGALSNHRCSPAASDKGLSQLAPDPGSLSQHGRDGKKFPFQCHLCFRGFQQQEPLLEHLPTHTMDCPFHCPYCDHSFMIRDALTNHLLGHFTQKPLFCYLCSQEFTKPMELAEHVSSHYTCRPFRCGQCLKSFSRPELLKEHLREHVAEKPMYCCKQCPRRFAHAGLLKEHLLCHTRTRPFHCGQCMRSFSFPGLLEEHKRKHAEEPSSTASKRSGTGSC